MVGVVDPPVAKVILEAPAHLHMIVIGDGDIPLVKEGVDIPPEEHPVGDLVALLDAEGDDMGSLEDRQGPLFADGAATVIGVGHHHLEGPLPNAIGRSGMPKPG